MFPEYKSFLEKKLSNQKNIQGDAYLISSSSLSVSLTDEGIDVVKEGYDKGIAIRLLSNQKLGFSYSSLLNNNSLKEMVENAIFSLKYSSPYKYHSLYSYYETPKKYDLSDKKISSLSYENLIDLLQKMKEKIKSFPKIKYIRNIKLSKKNYEVYWGTLFGSYKQYKLTNISAGVEVIAEENGEKQVGYYGRSYRKLSEFSAEKIAEEGAKRAIEKLGGKEIKTGKYNIILDKDVFAELLETMLSAFYGINIFKKKSLFFNDLGKKITKNGIELLNLSEQDVGFFYPFDDEGIDTKTYHIIKDGIFVSPIHTLESSTALNSNPTGNGFRAGYKNLPNSFGINIILKAPKTIETNNLYSFFHKAILVREGIGMHTINPISGDFSFGINGIYIEGGEIQFPVKGITISGNIKELLNQIVAVSEEIEFIGEGVVGRYVFIEDCNIAGS
jgi:PmbA protein